MYHYPHHIGDYGKKTAHLSNDEDLAYRRLIEMYYDREHPIPSDTQWVARRLRLGVEVIEVVLNDFFSKGDDGWHNKRCDDEIAKYHQMAARNRANGAKGGRKKNPVGSERDAAGNQWLSQPEPRTENLEPQSPPQPPKGGARKARVIERPESVPEQVWEDWLSVRKAKKFGAVTQTVMARMLTEAGKAGLTLAQAIEESASNEWRGFKADWLKSKFAKPEGASHAIPQTRHNSSWDVGDDRCSCLSCKAVRRDRATDLNVRGVV